MCFFEAPERTQPYTVRLYRNSFPLHHTRFIWWELYLAGKSGLKTNFEVYVEYYNPAGEIIHSSVVEGLYIASGWTESVHAAGIGYRLPGNWEPGLYEVKLFHNDILIAGGEFEIYP